MISNVAKGLLLRKTQPLAVSQARSYLVRSPPKYPMTTFERVFGFGFIMVGSLFPAGWILYHLDDYKGKGED